MHRQPTPARLRAFVVMAAALLLPALFTGGCQTVSGHLQHESLDRTLRSYERGLRWSNYAGILSMVKVEDGQPVPLPEDYEDYRVTAYDIVYAPVMPTDDTALQTVKIEYMDNNTQRVRGMTDRQQWSYDKDSKRWQLVTPFPLPAKQVVQ